LRFASIDGLRAVSVGLVLLHHLALSAAAGPPAPALYRLGQLGVTTFFVISGFVICRGLLRERETRGRISLASFYLRRCARILPPLLLLLATLTVASHAGWIEHAEWDSLRAIAFTCNLGALLGDCGWSVGHTWTLAFEEQFYIVFPLLLMWMPRAALAMLLLGIVPAMTVLLHLAGWGGASRFTANLVPIAYGVCLAFALPASRSVELRHRELFVALPLVLSIVLVAMPIEGRAMTALRLFLVPGLVSLAVGALTLGASATGRLLSLPIMVWLGRISYGIYLWQQPLLPPHLQATPAAYAIRIGLCLVLASLSHRFVERRLITWAQRRTLAADA